LSASKSHAMHIVVVGGLDPGSEDTWSGTPKAMIAGLRAAGHQVSTVGPLPSIDTGLVQLKAWWHGLDGKYYPAIRDLAALQRRKAPLAEALRALEPYDAVIACHAADAAIVPAAAPLIFVHDATWRLLLDFYPRYERRRLAQSIIQAGEALDRAALENSDVVIYSSRWAADAAQRDYGAPRAKLAVHPFGANLRRLPTSTALRRALAERGQNPCRLIFVGVDWRRKGGDAAIAVAQELNDRGVPCELDVVGGEPPEHRPDWVRAWGFLRRSSKQETERFASLLSRADFMILPTRADCTPIVLSEAAAYGLPTATTSVGGIPEIAGDAGWANAFPPGAPASAIADWIEGAWRDRRLYARMASLARRDYDRRLNWAAFTGALVEAIQRTQGAELKALGVAAGE